jgi:hypothetical protein
MIGSHTVIRHAYENVLNASARLISFATGIPTASRDGLINERQAILAADDLIMFALHARRLIENTASHKQFSQISIPAVSDAQKGKVPIPITRIINLFIHHKDIRIVRFTSELKILTGDWKDEDLLHKNIKHFSPIVIVESDHGKMATFQLRELVETFETEVLNPIVGLCAEDKFFLEDLGFES